MTRIFRTLFLALAGLAAMRSQVASRVSPETAASHLLRQVEPVYPDFARAAELEGVVRFDVSISASGQVYQIRMLSGPPSLQQAAQDAVRYYLYRPFEENGRPINVRTTVDVVFKTGEKAGPKAAYAAQKISMDDFTVAEAADSIAVVPARLRLWLQSHARTYGSEFSWVSAAEREKMGKEWIDSLKIFELPVKKAGVRLYFVKPETREACGANGNWEIELLEEDANGVRSVATESGWGYYASFRAGSVYPDIFIPSHLSAREQHIVGYVNASGSWGLLYCGSIQTDDAGKGIAEIEVCNPPGQRLRSNEVPSRQP